MGRTDRKCRLASGHRDTRLDSGRTLTNAWAGVTNSGHRRQRPPTPTFSEKPDLGRTPPDVVRNALGTLDAMAIAVAAIKTGTAHYFCPVTQSGRELSAGQLDALLRWNTGRLVISFDGDAAGWDSNTRLARAVAQRGRVPIVVELPEGADPASQLGKLGARGLMAWAPHPFERPAPGPPVPDLAAAHVPTL